MATINEREFFLVIFFLTGLKGRPANSKYLHINQDIKENIMSTFLAAVFAVIFNLIGIGHFIEVNAVRQLIFIAFAVLRILRD